MVVAMVHCCSGGHLGVEMEIQDPLMTRSLLVLAIAVMWSAEFLARSLPAQV